MSMRNRLARRKTYSGGRNFHAHRGRLYVSLNAGPAKFLRMWRQEEQMLITQIQHVLSSLHLESIVVVDTLRIIADPVIGQSTSG